MRDGGAAGEGKQSRGARLWKTASLPGRHADPTERPLKEGLRLPASAGQGHSSDLIGAGFGGGEGR